MAIAAQSDGDEVVSEINVTPLVDVMLVLLVVFIVTAPLLSNAVTVNLPKTAINAPPAQARALSVSVDALGKIYLDKSSVDLSRLESTLKSIHAARPDAAVQLNADQGVSYGLVAKVMSAVDRAGVTRLSVMTAGE
ncbi:MAG TPA: biopolymer transporter ExbD [Polyangiaceae bacterium]|jgi:biopolymer transport protein TolR|nr:biopolymer transporter ExbD [Polyangiaceae bacterium]